jgi:SH3-like domain-containing protein
MKPMKRLLPLMLVAGCFSLPANAVEYRTVDVATVLYDAPSQRGVKVFVIKRDTPVEVVVSLEGWSKVRDAEGSLAWIEKKYLNEKRSVVVTAERAEVRQKAEEGAPLVFAAEKSVALEYLEVAPGGWVKVRHHDGQLGFVRANQIWGF